MAANQANQYEGMFLFGPAGAEAENAINITRGIIERHGGQVLVIKKWDERKLAYELHGQKRGTYIISYFTAPGSAIAHIERDVKLSEDVLRVLITDAEHLSQKEMEAVEPQPIVREERREDRFGEGGGFGGPRGDRGDRDRGDRGERGPRGPRREEETTPAAANKE